MTGREPHMVRCHQPGMPTAASVPAQCTNVISGAVSGPKLSSEHKTASCLALCKLNDSSFDFICGIAQHFLRTCPVSRACPTMPCGIC